MQQMVPTPVALRRVLTWMPTTFHQGNRPCEHLPKKKTHAYEQKKGQYDQQGEQPIAFHQGNLPATSYLKKHMHTSRRKGNSTNEGSKIRSGSQEKWPTSGQGGYITPAASGIPTASKPGGKIRSGPQVGKVATSTLPPRGSPLLQSRGAKSEVAHKWARWLNHPCRLGDPHRFRAGGKIRSGP